MKRPIIIALIMLFFAPVLSPAQEETAKKHFDLAVQYYLSRNYEASMSEVNKSLALDKNYSPANKLLSVVSKRKDEELHQQKKMTITQEDAALVQEYFNWALAKYLNNDLIGAMEGVSQVLKIDPKHEKANDLLTKITKRIEAKQQDDEENPSLSSLIPAAKRNEKIRISFKDEDINVAVQALTQLLGINIIFAGDIEGTVNANFVDAPPEEVLRTILKSVGATYMVDGSVVRIVKMDNTQTITKLLRLKHTTLTSEQIGALKSNLSSSAQISYESKSHTLAVTDTYANILNTEQLIRKIDVPRKQVLIETKIIEVSVNKAKELGVNWDLSKLDVTVTGARVPTTFPFSKSNTFLREFTPQHSATETAVTSGESPYGFPQNDISSETINASDTTVAGWVFGSISAGSLSMSLKLIEDDTDTNILSSPQIMAMDDEESQINVGSTVPVALYQRNATTGLLELTGYTEYKLGITLKVTPKIHDDGYVTLAVHPSVNDSIVSLTSLSSGTPPITTTREVLATMRLKDGETAVIGGMIKEKDETTVHKVPVLGDIPILGWAFKYKNPKKEKIETLIFLTVHVVKEA